jgi:Spy/CpxP family protein refolding chaperone
MRRLLVALAVAVFASSLAVAPAPALAKHGDRDDHMMGHRKCPRGSHWVPAHRGRDGRWIPAHCQPRDRY